MKTALTIAGSDSSAGAGVQADLKTFAAHGVYGTSVVTAVTAQNTACVRAVHELPAEMVVSQIDAVAEDIEIHATKIGMLAGAGIVRGVIASLERWGLPNIVLDPVLVATDGTPLLTHEAIAIVRSDMLHLATVVTPNAAEAGILATMPVTTLDDARRAAIRILDLGARAVVVKGGHLNEPEAIDVFADNSGCREMRSPRVETRSSHGTGCAFAASIAANLALGYSLQDSAERAKAYVTEALRRGLFVGRGQGLLDHFWRFRNPKSQ